METSIKQKLYDLIEKIDDESILKQAYELIYIKQSSEQSDLWTNLSEEQQNEVLQSLEESDDPSNLIPHEEVKRRHKKWL